MIVVSDNSPLQYLVLIECIDALPALYGRVLTTPQVITARKTGIQAIGTLGVLIEAGLERLIDFDLALDRLATTTSFYASPNLMEMAQRIFRERQNEV